MKCLIFKAITNATHKHPLTHETEKMAADARITALRKEKTHTYTDRERKKKEKMLPSSLGSFVKSRFFDFGRISTKKTASCQK